MCQLPYQNAGYENMSYIKLSQVIIESPDYIAKYKFDLTFSTDKNYCIVTRFISSILTMYKLLNLILEMPQL